MALDVKVNGVEGGLNASIDVASLRHEAGLGAAPAYYSSTVSSSWAGAAAVGVTVARLPLAAVGIGLIVLGLPLGAALSFTAFALMDVVDGVVARRAGADGAMRRILDVLVDRVAIHSAALTACLVFGVGWMVWLVLLARDVAQAFTSFELLRRHRLVVIGAYWHMSYGLVMLIWGCDFILRGEPGTAISLVAGVVSLVTYVSYLDGCRKVVARAASFGG